MLIKKSRPVVGLLLSIGLVLNSFVVIQPTPKIQAAETVSMVVESVSSFGATDATNTAPGLRILPNTTIGYDVDFINNSDTTSISFPTFSVTYDAISVTTMDPTATPCYYVVAPRGTLRSSLSFIGAPSCFITPSGNTYRYQGPSDINPAETVYFRMTGVMVHYPSGGSHANAAAIEGLF